MLATALAVECAVLQNYYWHVRWTWKGRDGNLWRFHLANGLLSIISNLVWMRIFTGWLGIPVVPANLMAIALTSIVNFWCGERWVFRRPSPASAQGAKRGFHGALQRFARHAGQEGFH